MADLQAEYADLRARCEAGTATTTQVKRALTLAARLRAPSSLDRNPALSSSQPTPASKLSGLKAELAAGRVREAVAIAARFADLGEHRAAILDAHAAFTNPAFCRQLGRDPDALIEAGRQALQARYP